MTLQHSMSPALARNMCTFREVVYVTSVANRQKPSRYDESKRTTVDEWPPQTMSVDEVLVVGVRVHCDAQRTASATSWFRSISTAARPQDSRPRPMHFVELWKSLSWT